MLKERCESNVSAVLLILRRPTTRGIGFLSVARPADMFAKRRDNQQQQQVSSSAHENVAQRKQNNKE